MTQEIENTPAIAPFNTLGLHPSVLAAITAVGYEEPSPIQTQSIPLIMAGHDMIGQAQTGTGKTAAFALPILSRIDAARREAQVLVLAPTRELALQVATAFESFAAQMSSVNVVAIYGGAPMGPQLKAIRNGAQVIVATPGRLVDHLSRNGGLLSTIKFLVLDEADEMISMGFKEDLEKIYDFWINSPGTSLKDLSISFGYPASTISAHIKKRLNERKITIPASVPENQTLNEEQFSWVREFAGRIWKNAQLSLVNEVQCTCLGIDRQQGFYSNSCMRHALEQIKFAQYSDLYDQFNKP